MVTGLCCKRGASRVVIMVIVFETRFEGTLSRLVCQASASSHLGARLTLEHCRQTYFFKSLFSNSVATYPLSDENFGITP
jgi:hypothetical protein